MNCIEIHTDGSCHPTESACHPSVHFLESVRMQMTIPCQLCGAEFSGITRSHLWAKHGLTVSQYRERFPDAPMRSEFYRVQVSEQSTRVNADPARRAKQAERMKGSNNPFHGQKHSPAMLAHLSAKHKENHATGREKPSQAFLDHPSNIPTGKAFPEGGCSKVDREKSLRHYGHRCAICGFSEVVHNHHILGKKVSRAIAHMVILCPNHHALADLGKLTVERLLEITSLASTRTRRA